VADGAEARHEYGLDLVPWDALPRADAIVAAVAHRQFLARPLDDYLAKVADNGCFIDVKSQFDVRAMQRSGLTVWRL
jgi:UDP-N-acetyl-D-galactosamine dehydrogenase